MIKVGCPNGCSNAPPVPKPWRLRTELITCRNCTAVFRVPDGTPDGETVTGTLVARPGEAPPTPVVEVSVPLLRAQWFGIGIATNLALSALAVGGMALATGTAPALLGRSVGPNAPPSSDGATTSAFVAAWAFGPAIALAHVAGGFVVGWRSPGETIREPALAGLAAGAIGAIVLGGAPAWPTALVASAVLASALAALGGALGEHWQKRS